MSGNFSQAQAAKGKEPAPSRLGDIEEWLDGCRGQSCECILSTKSTKTTQPFLLYGSMDSNSKILGRFNAGTLVVPLKAMTKIIRHGKSTIEPDYEEWLEFKVEGKHGYTPTFPFDPCVEEELISNE